MRNRAEQANPDQVAIALLRDATAKNETPLTNMPATESGLQAVVPVTSLPATAAATASTVDTTSDTPAKKSWFSRLTGRGTSGYVYPYDEYSLEDLHMPVVKQTTNPIVNKILNHRSRNEISGNGFMIYH